MLKAVLLTAADKTQLLRPSVRLTHLYPAAHLTVLSFVTRESETSAARRLQQIGEISSDLRRADFPLHDDDDFLFPICPRTVPAASSLQFELRSSRNLAPRRFIGYDFLSQLRTSRTISTMRMAYCLLIVCTALTLCAHFAHARPGAFLLLSLMPLFYYYQIFQALDFPDENSLGA